jgi:hypothetical protein
MKYICFMESAILVFEPFVTFKKSRYFQHWSLAFAVCCFCSALYKSLCMSSLSLLNGRSAFPCRFVSGNFFKPGVRPEGFWICFCHLPCWRERETKVRLSAQKYLKFGSFYITHTWHEFLQKKPNCLKTSYTFWVALFHPPSAKFEKDKYLCYVCLKGRVYFLFIPKS